MELDWAIEDKEKQLDADIKKNERDIELKKREVTTMKGSVDLDFVRMAETELAVEYMENAVVLLKKYKSELFPK